MKCVPTTRASITLISVLVCMVIGATVPAFAVDTTFSQKILPLNCVFTVVNAGTGELHYVTPEACGVYVPPPDTGSTAPATSTANAAAPSLTTSNSLTVKTAHSQPPQNSTGYAASHSLLPWKPLTTIARSKLSTVHPSTLIRTPGAIVMAASLVLFVTLAIVLV
ncbi:MAG TPA: hypothetical protein VFN56_05190 [Candidatus Saccharimonadales bacterium]|nr:hypothetical protein [Candidatus Saccharimonadales bacterium]